MKNIILTVLAAIGLATPACGGRDTGIPVLAPQEFNARAKADSTAVIIDVRTPDEYAAGHLRGALQLDFLDTKAFGRGIKRLDKKHTYYIYCRSGKRSHAACLQMQKRGLTVVDMQGGYLNWTAQGLETETR